MLRLLRFYAPYVGRAFALLFNTARRLDTWGGVVTTSLGVFGVGGGVIGAALQLVPWYVPGAVFGALFLYGLLRVNQENYREIEAERNRAQRRLATDEKRIALKDLLGEAREEGPHAHARAHETGDLDALSRWTNETRDLIEAAFGKGEAQLFLSDEGYPTHSLPGSPGNDAWAALAQFNVSARNRREREIGYRLRRLDSLILRADSLPIRPDFDPQGWTDRQ